MYSTQWRLYIINFIICIGEKMRIRRDKNKKKVVISEPQKKQVVANEERLAQSRIKHAVYINKRNSNGLVANLAHLIVRES